MKMTCTCSICRCYNIGVSIYTAKQAANIAQKAKCDHDNALKEEKSDSELEKNLIYEKDCEHSSI